MLSTLTSVLLWTLVLFYNWASISWLVAFALVAMMNCHTIAERVESRKSIQMSSQTSNRFNSIKASMLHVLAVVLYASARGAARVATTIGLCLHSYQVVGLDQVLKNQQRSGVLLVFYHGPMSIDIGLFVAHFYLRTGRLIRCVAGRALFRVPLWHRLIGDVVFTGTIEHCAQVLREGHVLLIAPGGKREANFSHRHQVLWHGRSGFARVAIEAQVPIVPVFTRNVRLATYLPGVLRNSRFVRRMYELHRLVLVPVYDIVPVKLVTYFGPAITAPPPPTCLGAGEKDENDSNPHDAQWLARKTRRAMRRLIRVRQYQMSKNPASYLRALGERFKPNSYFELPPTGVKVDRARARARAKHCNCDSCSKDCPLL